MDSTQFLGGHTYGGFYVGLGLYISLFLLFSAILAWQLGDLAMETPHAIGAMGWSFCALQLAGVALACVYIGIGPAVFSAVAAVCLGWAMWRAGSASSSARDRLFSME